MDKIRIFCEGLSDQRFLRDFIHLNYSIEVTDKQLKNNEFIHCLGGWTNLKKNKSRITEEFSDYSSIIFLDADDDDTIEKPGIIETKKFVADLMLSWNWSKYDLYVFPNNHDEKGEVEDFFENIINKNNIDIFECWSGFENCLKSKNENYLIPAKKSKIYLYHEALEENKDKCKDMGRDFKDSKLWDLDINNSYLKPLKEFLDKYLI